MQNRTRERVGLVIFLVLVVLGGGLLGAYFLTGRSWSVAATMVDDSVGSLDDYTVVAFAGVVPPEDDVEPSASGESSAVAGSSGAAASSDAEDLSASAGQSASPAPDDEVSPEFTMEDAFGSSADSEADTGIRESIMSVFEREDRKRAAGDDAVYVSDVRDIYSLKGADGLTLNLADPERYAEPAVLGAGGKRIGVFSVSSYLSRAKLKSVETSLREEGAEAIVCIAPRTSLLSTYDGLDVVVLTSPAEGRTDERDSQGTLVVDAPYVGEVGVVILSSNNVPSYKVVKEL